MRPALRIAAGWPLWLAGGAALLVAGSAGAYGGDGGAARASAEPVVVGSPGAPTTVAPARHVLASAPTTAPPPRLDLAAAPTLLRSSLHPQVPDTVFRHQDHERVDCLSCHTVDPVHGEVRVRTLSDCRSCHHREPLESDCARCHEAADVPSETYALPRIPELSVGRAPERPLPFRHEDHPGVSCASCHTGGVELSAAQVECASCHQEHHRPEARCASCHLPALEAPPHALEVHAGCGGAGCHSELPFEGVPRTRNFCVTCHQQSETHRPGPQCTSCHLLPRPREGEGGGPAAPPGAR